MSPTINSVFAAVLANSSIPREHHKDLIVKGVQLPETKTLLAELAWSRLPELYESPYLAATFMQIITSTGPLHLAVEIKSKHDTKLPEDCYRTLQIPLEPITSLVDWLLAVHWLCSPSRTLWLLPNLTSTATNPHQYSLLGQATLAGLGFDSALAFELANAKAPADIAKWRAPDGEKVGQRITIPSLDAHMGTMYVHCHNGVVALVSDGTWRKSMVVHLRHAENATIKELNALLDRTTDKVSTRQTHKKLEEERKDCATVAELLETYGV